MSEASDSRQLKDVPVFVSLNLSTKQRRPKWRAGSTAVNQRISMILLYYKHCTHAQAFTLVPCFLQEVTVSQVCKLPIPTSAETVNTPWWRWKAGRSLTTQAEGGVWFIFQSQPAFCILNDVTEAEETEDVSTKIKSVIFEFKESDTM